MSFAIVNYTGNGSTTTYSITFPYITSSHVVVKVDNVVKTAGTDYTFPTSSTIQFTSVPANGSSISISRSSSRSARLVDYQDGATITEAILDQDSNQLFYISQEAFDTADNSILLDTDNKYNANSKVIKNIASPVNDNDAVNKAFITTNLPAINTVNTNIASVATVASNIGNINAVNSNSANINSVASNSANINSAVSNATNINAVVANAQNINTAAGANANITAVAGQITPTNNIGTLAGLATQITGVYNIRNDVTAVNSNSANINSVASNMAAVTAVNSNSANINAVNSNSSNINTIATNIGKVNTLYTEIAKVVEVANDLQEAVSEIDTVANNITNVNLVGNNIANVNAVNSNSSNINSVVSNAGNINTVASNSSNITAVANNSTNINAVNANSANINAVNANSANINLVSGSIANVNSVGNSITAVNTVSNNLAGINSFAERYRISATAPTTSLDIGDLWYDSANSNLRVYTANGWQIASDYIQNLVNDYRYDITGSPSYVEGASNNANAAVFDYAENSLVNVFVNGLRIIPTEDYTLSKNNNVARITFTNPLINGDVVYIQVFRKLQTVEEQTLQSYVATALGYRNTAQTAATNSANSATASANSATSAASSATTATTKASEAATSATNAANSATSASTSASTATTKASEASTSATNAATSASNAATSATTATTKATEASTSASNAATSASSASSSATSASSSASTATTQATNASNSATAAANSATASQNSATASAASASSAAASLNTFLDSYSAGATAPNNPTNGDLWFDTVNTRLKIYVTANNTGWVNAGAYLEGLLTNYTYNATAGQTIFTGADVDNKTFAYSGTANVFVFVNGIRIVPVQDYTLSNGNRLTLVQAANSGDIIYMEVIQKISLTEEVLLQGYVSSASNSALTATTQAGIATTQAGIATTKAGEASASASAALTSKNNAATSEANALSYRNTTEGYKNDAQTAKNAAEAAAALATVGGGAFKITANDTTANVFNLKVNVGNGITKTLNNAGGNESVTLSLPFTETVITPTNGQTVFNTTYVVNFVQVYVNGVKLIKGVDFTATNGTTITLNDALLSNDVVEIVKFA